MESQNCKAGKAHKIIEPNHSHSTAKAMPKPRPQVPCPHGFQVPPGLGTPPLGGQTGPGLDNTSAEGIIPNIKL